MAIPRMPSVLICAFAALLLPGTGMMHAAAPPVLPVMILDGEANEWHDWRATTPMLRRMLEEPGRFRATVVTAPAGADLGGFSPDFKAFAAVVLNYDAPDGRWPPSLRAGLERYVREGGGLVLVHAANNAFPSWPEFNRMAGIGGWRDRNASAGPYWYVDGQGRLVADASPGPAGTMAAGFPSRSSCAPSIPSPAACRRAGCTRRTSCTPACAVPASR